MLHPLWPQNKWLHTLRTTDYRHTRQDGWIQTELAFTLAKNATKPNPFEVVPLQTTRKENNWKTEEALARAAITLETERIKGSNPWCLWWWWWWWWLILWCAIPQEKENKDHHLVMWVAFYLGSKSVFSVVMNCFNRNMYFFLRIYSYIGLMT